HAGQGRGAASRAARLRSESGTMSPATLAQLRAGPAPPPTRPKNTRPPILVIGLSFGITFSPLQSGVAMTSVTVWVPGGIGVSGSTVRGHRAEAGPDRRKSRVEDTNCSTDT